MEVSILIRGMECTDAGIFNIDRCLSFILDIDHDCTFVVISEHTNSLCSAIQLSVIQMANQAVVLQNGGMDYEFKIWPSRWEMGNDDR
jgi:hypothetical protein